MATKEEIIGAIRLGIEAGEQTFGELSDEQLATKIYPGENGWTAKEVLAHLAGRQGAYDMLFNLASGGELPQPSEGGFDVDGWNQRIVDERVDRPRDELLAEFRVVHEDLINRVNELSDDVLAAPVTTPRGQSTAGDVLLGSGGMHSVNHSNDVAEALGTERG
jgi:uncharacterized protein (TIGR03083 family)